MIQKWTVTDTAHTLATQAPIEENLNKLRITLQKREDVRITAHLFFKLRTDKYFLELILNLTANYFLILKLS